MEYVVIREFTDKDDKRKYLVGARYPYKGWAKKERLEELSTDKNRRGIPLIAPKEAEKEVVEETTEKPVEKAEKSESVKKRKVAKK